MVNRRFAKEALICGKNLCDTKRYAKKGIFIYDSACADFKFLNFAIRKALKNKEIYRSKEWNQLYVQMDVTSEFVQIEHVNDLIIINSSVPDRKK